MKSLFIALLGVALLGCQSNAQQKKKVELKTQKDKVSYSIGVTIGNNIKQQSLDLDLDVVLAGMKDILSGGKAQMTDDEIRQTMMAMQEEMQHKMEEKSKKEGEENKTKGTAFLAANKSKDGVKTTASGLQYKVIKSGTGKTPKADDNVSVNYKGTLIDGTEFDASQPGQPVSFPVNGVIKGWTEALQLMKEGDKWQLFIPSELAYGERSAGPKIGPNSTLVFEVELLSINEKKDGK